MAGVIVFPSISLVLPAWITVKWKQGCPVQWGQFLLLVTTCCTQPTSEVVLPVGFLQRFHRPLLTQIYFCFPMISLCSTGLTEGHTTCQLAACFLIAVKQKVIKFKTLFVWLISGCWFSIQVETPMHIQGVLLAQHLKETMHNSWILFG